MTLHNMLCNRFQHVIKCHNIQPKATDFKQILSPVGPVRPVGPVAQAAAAEAQVRQMENVVEGHRRVAMG